VDQAKHSMAEPNMVRILWVVVAMKILIVLWGDQGSTLQP